jgi:hypothetical protein
LVSGVSAVVSAAFLGLPAKLGCICPRICAHFGVSASGSGAPNICIFHCSRILFYWFKKGIEKNILEKVIVVVDFLAVNQKLVKKLVNFQVQ